MPATGQRGQKHSRGGSGSDVLEDDIDDYGYDNGQTTKSRGRRGRAKRKARKRHQEMPRRYITLYDAVAGRVAIDRFLPNRPFTATTRDRLTSKTVPATPDQVLARRRKVVPERLPGGTTVTGARSEADRMENEDGDERLEGRGRRRSSSPSNFFTIADALAGTTEDDDARAEADEEEELLDMPDIQDLPTSGTEHRSKRPPKRLFKKPPQDPSSSFPAAFFSPACLPDATLLPASDMLQAIHAYASDYYARATRARGRAGDWYSMDETALLALGVLLEEACLLSLGDTGDLALVEGGESDVLDVDMNLEGGITRNEDEDEDEDKEQHE